MLHSLTTVSECWWWYLPILQTYIFLINQNGHTIFKVFLRLSSRKSVSNRQVLDREKLHLLSTPPVPGTNVNIHFHHSLCYITHSSSCKQGRQHMLTVTSQGQYDACLDPATLFHFIVYPEAYFSAAL